MMMDGVRIGRKALSETARPVNRAARRHPKAVSKTISPKQIQRGVNAQATAAARATARPKAPSTMRAGASYGAHGGKRHDPRVVGAMRTERANMRARSAQRSYSDSMRASMERGARSAGNRPKDTDSASWVSGFKNAWGAMKPWQQGATIGLAGMTIGSMAND